MQSHLFLWQAWQFLFKSAVVTDQKYERSPKVRSKFVLAVSQRALRKGPGREDVHSDKDGITLRFRAKGGKRVEKIFTNARLSEALARLGKLPGRRLFQFADENGEVRCLRSKDVNDYLKQIAGCAVSLKDFRTLCGSADALDVLVKLEPASTARGRKKQIRQALEAAAHSLENTPTVCRKSYVHPAIITAFETGTLQRMAKALSSNSGKEKAVAEIIVAAA